MTKPFLYDTILQPGELIITNSYMAKSKVIAEVIDFFGLGFLLKVDWLFKTN